MSAPPLPTLSPTRRLQLANVFTKSLADRGLMTILFGLGLGLMGVWIGQLYVSLSGSLAEMVAQFPGATIQIFGDFATATGFINAEVYSIFAPALLIYLGLTCATRSFAGEQEDQTLDLLAANPISRRSIMFQKAAAITVQIGLVAVLTGGGVYLGALLADLQIPLASVVAVTLNFWLLGSLFAALAMLISVITGHRLMSVIITAFLALVVYIWGALLPLSETLSGLAAFSPWDWYFGSDPLSNGFDWPGAGLLALATALLWVVALWAFDRRDLPG